MSTSLTIAIAEPSVLIRSGLETLLKRLGGFRLHITEIAHPESLQEILRTHRPDILIINPSVPGYLNLPRLKEESARPDLKCMALVYTAADPALLRCYDGQISVYDSPDEIRHKLECLIARDENATNESEEQLALSSREKEIVVCVVKGMTNREIADKLFLSTHTVVTHRRNIARKLQIHSASGLTVYAIVNKLVELNDIQK